MSISAIGFANKFYTLWDITEETKPLGNGCYRTITYYNYIKNISFDKETAITKYPNAILDGNLRGKTLSWVSEPKEVWTNVDVFRFGKYKYSKIDENTDTKYIAWYWEQINDEDHKDYVLNVLKSRGYEVRISKYDNEYRYVISPEQILEEKRLATEVTLVMNELLYGEGVYLDMKANPDMIGDYRVGNIIWHFQEVKENWYNGFNYYLPVLNGKQKRVKNKTLFIKNYTFINEDGILKIEILDFEICK